MIVCVEPRVERSERTVAAARRNREEVDIVEVIQWYVVLCSEMPSRGNRSWSVRNMLKPVEVDEVFLTDVRLSKLRERGMRCSPNAFDC